MKKEIITMVLLISSMVGFSNTTFKNGLNDNEKKLIVKFKNVIKGNLLNVKDENGNILYSETVSVKGDLSKILDVTSLKEGNYLVELEKDFEIIIKKIKVTSDKVVLISDSKKVIFKPLIRNKENLLMISKIEFDDEPTHIEIYFENKSIFSETVTDETLINRVYRLDSSKKGNYSMVVSNQNRVYYKHFKL